MFNFESNLNIKSAEGKTNFSENKLDKRINELSVSENFVKSFFYEAVKAKKEMGSLYPMMRRCSAGSMCRASAGRAWFVAAVLLSGFACLPLITGMSASRLGVEPPSE